MEVDVAIAGAGPAGLATAAALLKADPSLKVQLFERTGMKARGAAVLIGANGLLALQAIDPAIVQGLLSKAIKLEGSDRYDYETGAHIEFLAMQNDTFKERYGFHNSLLGWSDIVEALRSSLPPGSITTGCSVSGFRQLPGGGGQGVQLLGGDGEPLVTARAVVGADGWFSGIRRQLQAVGPPTFKDVVVWRARVPWRPDWLRNPIRTKWWVPPGGGPSPGAMLAVLIPVPGGDMVWQCHAPVAMMRERGASFDPLVGEAASSHAENAAAGGAKARCLQVFGHVAGMADFLRVVEETPDSQVTEHGLYQTTPEQLESLGHSWGSGMVTLAGDAAHAAYVDGTGMAMSFEDAAVLGWHVQQGGLTEASLRAYESERLPRVKAVFGLATRQAAARATGVPQKALMEERAALLYGEAKFRPVGAAAAAAAAGAAKA